MAPSRHRTIDIFALCICHKHSRCYKVYKVTLPPFSCMCKKSIARWCYKAAKPKTLWSITLLSFLQRHRIITLLRHRIIVINPCVHHCIITLSIPQPKVRYQCDDKPKWPYLDSVDKDYN